jgi:hypothetical protein
MACAPSKITVPGMGGLVAHSGSPGFLVSLKGLRLACGPGALAAVLAPFMIQKNAHSFVP